MKLKVKKGDIYFCPLNIVFEEKDNDYYYYYISDDFIIDLTNVIKHNTNSTNYTSMLIKLMFKADIHNLRKLSAIYKYECFTIWAYKNINDFLINQELNYYS